MFRRLKRALVESYIGAIGLGILLADAMLAFVGTFVAPVASWASQRTLQPILQMTEHVSPSQSFPFREALPPLERCVVLLCVWYLLFLWLYVKPPESATASDSAPQSGPTP